MSRDMFLLIISQFCFLPSKLCLFSLKSSLEFIFHRRKPNFIRDRSFITSLGEGAGVLEGGKKLDFGGQF